MCRPSNQNVDLEGKAPTIPDWELLHGNLRLRDQAMMHCVRLKGALSHSHMKTNGHRFRLKLTNSSIMQIVPAPKRGRMLWDSLISFESRIISRWDAGMLACPKRLISRISKNQVSLFVLSRLSSREAGLSLDELPLCNSSLSICCGTVEQCPVCLTINSMLSIRAE